MLVVTDLLPLASFDPVIESGELLPEVGLFSW
jgi:hypothetical protein